MTTWFTSRSAGGFNVLSVWVVVLLACSQSGRLPSELSLAGKRAAELWDGQVVMSDHEPGDLHWERLHTAFPPPIKEPFTFFLVTECIIQEWHFAPLPLCLAGNRPSYPDCKFAAAWLQILRTESECVFLKSLMERQWCLLCLC